MPFGFRKGKGTGGQGFGRGKGSGGSSLGQPPANCICPQCKTVSAHTRGVPCFKTKCPNCGSAMTRQFLDQE